MNSEKISPSTLSRRELLKGAAATGLALTFTKDAPSSTTFAQEATSEIAPAKDRDPLVEGFNPSIVGTTEEFKQVRGFDIRLNTQAESITEIDVQNRFDRAALEMFNVMKSNESLLAMGGFGPLLAEGTIPTGTDTTTFAQELKATEGEFLITTMFYPEWAQHPTEGVWGQFDAKKGVRLNFTEEYGLFDLTWDAMSGAQNYGITPRLTEENGLQLDIYKKNELPPPGHPNYENAPDLTHTWMASNAMQIMTLSYGNKEVYMMNATQQNDLLFNPPYAANTVIAAEMFNKLPDSQNFVNLNVPNKKCLLDYAPIKNNH